MSAGNDLPTDTEVLFFALQIVQRTETAAEAKVWATPLSVAPRHLTGQLLSPAGRCLSISTVHGGAGGGAGLAGREGEAAPSTAASLRASAK